MSGKTTLFALMATVSTAWSAPFVGYLNPSSFQVGTTNRVIVGGQVLPSVRGGWVSGSGVNVVDIEQVPNFNPPGTSVQRKYLLEWINAVHFGDRSVLPKPDDPHITEWRSNRWWEVINTFDDFHLSLIARELLVQRNPLQLSPSLRQRLILTIVVDADAEEGERELVLWGRTGVSAPKRLLVTRCGNKSETGWRPPKWGRTEPVRADVFPVILNGCVMPGEVDSFVLSLKRSVRYFIRTVARSLQPYIGDAVPGFFNPVLTVKGANGGKIAFADDRYFDPDPVLEFTVPEDGDYTLEIRDNLYRGREDFVYAISVAESPEVNQGFTMAIPQLPSVLSSSVSRHVFTASEAGTFCFDLLARRAGSPLDAVITLLDGDNRRLAVFDDTKRDVFIGLIAQGECDPVAKYFIPEAGEYTVEVADRTGRCGDDFRYDLRIAPPRPRFDVYASPSSFAVSHGQTVPITFHVLRHDGFGGAVRLQDNWCFHFTRSVIPASSNEFTTAIQSLMDFPGPIQEFSLDVTADVAGRTVSERVIPCNETEQAFAWKHLLPARAFLVKPLPPNKGGGGKKWKRRK